MSGPRATPFDLWPTPIGAEDLARLRGPIRRAADRKLHELKRSGCKAAQYRLTGAEVESICVVVLPHNHRLLICFPAENEVAVLLAGPHDETNPGADVYTRLYRSLDIEVPGGERRKPTCCDGPPPVDAELPERFIAGSKHFQREERRRRRAKR